jgi:type VI secretion system protein ImpC
MELDFGFPGGRRTGPDGEQAALRVLLLGDFSARGGIGAAAPASRRPLVRLEVGGIDQALAAVGPQLSLPATQPPSLLAPRRLEDFHPDELFRALPMFAGLAEVRRRLLDPATFADTAAALERKAAPAEDVGSTLERLLGAPRPAPAAPDPGDVSRFISAIVAPHVTPDIAARQRPLVAAVDEALCQHMRGLLQDRAFRRLEALWRAAHRLVGSIDSEEDIGVFLLDVARPELAGEGAALARRLGDGAPDGRRWSLLVLDESFGPGDDDVALLAALAAMAAEVGAPLVAAASPALLGLRSLLDSPDPAGWPALGAEDAARWQALRQSPDAASLGLVMPRLLARLPYGAKTDPVESFPFDELGSARSHEAYLWANPAFGCAELVVAAFAAGRQPGEVLELADLPAHVYKEGGESRMQAPAEVYLADRAARALLDRGLMPLLSARDRNVVRLGRLQSVADPPGPLAIPR